MGPIIAREFHAIIARALDDDVLTRSLQAALLADRAAEQATRAREEYTRQVETRLAARRVADERRAEAERVAAEDELERQRVVEEWRRAALRRPANNVDDSGGTATTRDWPLFTCVDHRADRLDFHGCGFIVASS